MSNEAAPVNAPEPPNLVIRNHSVGSIESQYILGSLTQEGDDYCCITRSRQSLLCM